MLAAVSSVVFSRLAALAGLLAILLLPPPPPAHSAAVGVSATVETEPVVHPGDAADDSAIWIHPTDPSQSTIIGTDKTDFGGLDVYDLTGRRLFFYPDGRLNNVDLRYNFPLGGLRVTLVGASNRVLNTLDFYAVNQSSRSLTKVGSVSTSPAIAIARGFALYHSPQSGRYFAFVADRDSGVVEQYELSGQGGAVTGTLVRSFDNGGPSEGMVTDDELKRLYVAEEVVGNVWRYGAEAAAGADRAKVDTSDVSGGHLFPYVKGLTIYYGSLGTGYLLAASQGNGTFQVYGRSDNSYRGSFGVIASGEIDGVTGQDGIDVTDFPLGAVFPRGLFITQDHVNDGANQNHKLVPWPAIARAFDPPLLVDPFFDPRTVGTAAPNEAASSGGEVPSSGRAAAPDSTSTSPPATSRGYGSLATPAAASLRVRRIQRGTAVKGRITIGFEGSALRASLLARSAELESAKLVLVGRAVRRRLKAATLPLKVGLSAKARRALRRRGSLKLRLQVVVSPPGSARAQVITRPVLLRR